MVRARLDIIGDKYGLLTVLKSHNLAGSNGVSRWVCRCDCGNEKIVRLGNLRNGHTKSCGCQKDKKGKDNKIFKHGHNASSKPYKSWCKIKERCFNQEDKSYKNYGGRGILMSAEFVNDFLAFYAEIGDPPENTKYYSVGRIDNDRGYERGNIRWETADQQARNLRKKVTNTSGVTGVALREYKESGTLYAIAEWSDGESKSMSKKFSVKKLGLLPAFAAAVKFRECKIAELNALGYGYSEKHGK